MRATTAACASSASVRITDAARVGERSTAANGRRFHCAAGGVNVRRGRRSSEKGRHATVRCRALSKGRKGRRKEKGFPEESPFKVARLAGFEPTTPWFVAKYSIQLSYSRTQNGTSQLSEPSAMGRFPKRRGWQDSNPRPLVRSQVLYPTELQHATTRLLLLRTERAFGWEGPRKWRGWQDSNPRPLGS